MFFCFFFHYFEHISQLFLVFLLLLWTGKCLLGLYHTSLNLTIYLLALCCFFQWKCIYFGLFFYGNGPPKTFVSPKHITEDDIIKRESIFPVACAAQKMKFSINDFFSKCHQIRSFQWMWSYLLKKFSRILTGKSHP